MPTEYRVELAKSGRAGCTDTLCKKEGHKISKGELRFGSWVEISEHGSFKWKHWGCVSGDQMQKVYDVCNKDGDENLKFDWFDGYDELNDHPEIQEKIRRCIEQRHIDAEDFNGDPEWNKPGVRGIRPRASAKKAEDNNKEDTDAAPTPVKKGGKRARKASDDEDEDIKPSKKSKKSSKKVEPDDDESEDAKPAKRTKKTSKKASRKVDDEAKVSKPAKKSIKKSIKKEAMVETDDEAADAKPVKVSKKSSKANKKSARKVKMEDESEGEEVALPIETKKAAKAKAGGKTTTTSTRPKRGRPAKGTLKEDATEDEKEDDHESETEAAPPKKARSAKKVRG